MFYIIQRIVSGAYRTQYGKLSPTFLFWKKEKTYAKKSAENNFRFVGSI